MGPHQNPETLDFSDKVEERVEEQGEAYLVNNKQHQNRWSMWALVQQVSSVDREHNQNLIYFLDFISHIF